MPTNKLSELLLKRVDELEIALSEVLAEVSSLPKPKDGISIKGDKGDKGERGRDGKDGKSIRGADGKDGKDGRDGVSIKGDKGDDGLSAYEIWLNNGNKGTERQFLASLKGEKGEDGKFLLREVQTVHGSGGGSAQSVLNKINKKLVSDYVPYTGATQDIDLTSKNLTTTGKIINRNIQASLSCGVHEGMEVTINVDPTKFDISAGTYTIIDNWTDPQAPVEYNITYPGVTGVAVENLATANFSYILIDKDQNIIQLTTFPNDVQHRNAIMLAQAGHTNRLNLAGVNPQVEVFASPIEQLRDYWNFFSIANKGNIISANGANLSINKSIGYLFAAGANFYNEPKDPNVVELEAVVLATFRRRTQTGQGGSAATTLDVGNYDVAGTITPTTGVKYTNQRVYIFPNGNIIVQYGQEQYTNMANAIAAIPTEPYVVYANLEGNAAFVAVISVRSTATDLSDDAQAIFTRIDATTGFPSGSSGTSTTTLQQAYENSNANPEILTNATGGSLTLRRGSNADTDDVLAIQNNAGTKTFSITAEGNVAANNLSGVNTGDQDLSGLTTGAASSTDNAIARFDDTTGKIIQNSLATISDTGLLTATGLNISLNQNDFTNLQVINTDTTDINSRSRIVSVANHPIIGMIGGGSQPYGLHLDPDDSNNLKENFSSLTVSSPFRVVEAATGSTTLPRQPMFWATISANLTNITGDGTDVTIVFDSEVEDRQSNYNAATGVFTAPTTGLYSFSAGVAMSGLTASHTRAIFGFNRTGGTETPINLSNFANERSSANDLFKTISVTIPLDASDAVSVRLQVSNGTKVVTLSSNLSRTFFSGHLIG